MRCPRRSLAAIAIAIAVLPGAECFLYRSLATSGSRAGAALSVSLRKRLTKVGTYSSSGGLTSSQGTHKIAYYGSVAVGDPAQSFQVVFDTGSGSLILPGIDCSSRACEMHTQWDFHRSTSAQRVKCDGSAIPSGELPDKVNIKFGAGQITGECFKDKICVGAACALGNACAVGDLIVATDESHDPFALIGSDGLLGLARPSLARGASFSIMERLHLSNPLRKPIFSVFLSGSDSEASVVTFGAYKEEHMASDLFWVDVMSSSGYWEVQISDITFDGQPQALCEGCKVVLDTGTSMLAGPTDVINELREKLGISPTCSNYGTLPRLGFIVSGRILDLTPKEYVNNVNGVSCSATLTTVDVPPPIGPLFIFGIPFLQKYYTVYDNANARVGFAVANHVEEFPEGLVLENSSAHAQPQRGSFLSRKHMPEVALSEETC